MTLLPLRCFVNQHKASAGSLVLQLHVFRHNVALALITLDLKDEEKIKHLLFKVVDFTYHYHSYQETVLASWGTVIFETGTKAPT